MKDRDKLTQFVSIVDEILKIEGNAWLIDELLLTIENHATYAQLRKHPLITRIHEYCVEEIIEKQAEEFYKDFPIEEIKEQLIVDFKEMEHQRNRDNFWKFSLHIYRQIEYIMNYLVNKYIIPNWDVLRNQIVTNYVEDKNKKNNNENNKRIIKRLYNTVGLENKNKSLPRTIHASQFFEISLCCFYFELGKNSYRKNLINNFNKLQTIRNQVHRPTNYNNYQQKLADDAEKNISMTYLSFYSFLEDYIRKIQTNYENRVQAITGSEMHQSQSPQKSNEISHSSGNTLGDLNPQLGEAFNRMKQNEAQ